MRLISDRGKAECVSERNKYFLDEPDFREMLNLERKRSLRSKKPLLLMHLDISGMIMPHFDRECGILLKSFPTCTRETDVQGWYERESVIGILFTEIESVSPSLREALQQRVMTHLVGSLGPSILYRIKVAFYVYAEGKVHYEAVDHDGMRCHKHLSRKTAKFSLSAKFKRLVNEASNFLMY